MFDNLKKSIIFATVLLSGIAFTISILTARIYFPEKLTDVIFFQSTTVFVTFIIQIGLRAGLRNHHHLGSQKTVVIVDNTIRKIAFWICLPLVLVSSFQDFYSISFGMSVLQAFLTMCQGVRIAQGKPVVAAIYSLAVFLSIIASTFFIILTDSEYYEKILIIDIISLSIMGVISLYTQLPSKGLYLLNKIVRKYSEIQISSFLIYLLVFITSQLFVVLSYRDNTYALVFADVQIWCGAQILVFTRAIVFFEGRLLRDGKINNLVSMIVIWSLLFSILFAVFAYYVLYEEYVLVYFVLSFALMGRISFPLASQFVNRSGRRIIYVSCLINIAVLFGILLSVVNDFYKTNDLIFYMLGFFSLGFSALILTFFSFVTKKELYVKKEKS